jgi:Flp pilus assembly CpaE family ATPase
MSGQELTDRVEKLKKDLEEAQRTVNSWDQSKRDDASATMYSKSLSALYESQIQPK